MRAPARMCGNALALALVATAGHAQEVDVYRTPVAALEATFGPLLLDEMGNRKHVTVTEYQSSFYPTLRFFRGRVPDAADGLAVQLPNGTVVPLGAAPVRFLIADHAVVDVDNLDAIASYALELLQMEGHIPLTAHLLSGVDDLPQHGRAKARYLNLALDAPTIVEGSEGGRSKRLVCWVTDGSLLVRATVVIGAQRIADHVVTVRPMMEY